MKNLGGEKPANALVTLLRAVERWSRAVDRLTASRISPNPELNLGNQMAETLMAQEELLNASDALRKMVAP